MLLVLNPKGLIPRSLPDGRTAELVFRVYPNSLCAIVRSLLLSAPKQAPLKDRPRDDIERNKRACEAKMLARTMVNRPACGSPRA